ncbi:MAG: adenosylmethionine decarboxylase [Patescibacteria group bacterium]|nr:adenosylmethionine decarboxylase [Patescibacteria group bacterium]MDE2173366.1 adenosylmethionine decarboxylase [Patescibacteria group bacterium]
MDEQVRKQKSVIGLHILGEVYTKEISTLSNFSSVRDTIVESVAKAGLSQVGTAEHVFPEGGFTFVILLAESHLSIHTWPELGYLNMDVFVCNVSKDNSVAARNLFDSVAELFRPYEVVKREVIR